MTQVQPNHVQQHAPVMARVLPQHPLGSPGVTADEVHAHASDAAFAGAERGDVTALMVAMQNIAVESGLKNQRAVLAIVNKIIARRIDRVIAQVKVMPDMNVPGMAGMFSRVAAGPSGLISRAMVMELLTAAREEQAAQ